MPCAECAANINLWIEEEISTFDPPPASFISPHRCNNDICRSTSPTECIQRRRDKRKSAATLRFRWSLKMEDFGESKCLSNLAEPSTTSTASADRRDGNPHSAELPWTSHNWWRDQSPASDATTPATRWTCPDPKRPARHSWTEDSPKSWTPACWPPLETERTQTQLNWDDTQVFVKRRLHLKWEIYCQELPRLECIIAVKRRRRLRKVAIGSIRVRIRAQQFPLACEFTILIEVLLPTSASYPSVGAWLNLITMSCESEGKSLQTSVEMQILTSYL